MHELWNKRGVYKEENSNRNNQRNYSISSREKYEKTPSYNNSSSYEGKNNEIYEKPSKVPYDHSHSWPPTSSQSINLTVQPAKEQQQPQQQHQPPPPPPSPPSARQTIGTLRKSLFSIVNQKRMLAKYKQVVFSDTINVNRTKQMRINQARGFRSNLIVDDKSNPRSTLNTMSTSSNESSRMSKQNKKVAFASTVKEDIGNFDFEDDNQLDNMDEVFSDIQDPVIDMNCTVNNNNNNKDNNAENKN